ncbi:MAG: hypothetical protein D8M58_13175 [Calditrichaeota bacterium]|nr:MAG: hypothetical protein DWQ03_13960 [Calditrichota bacterium]MBL1206352.1 hypothetical protein [Calditrichota bacterium]NOG46178.1 hypothetical protein [Calditrichota bacterium]
MGYIVKEADLVKERDIMVNILTNNRSAGDFDYNKRFEWIYLNNPFGKAKAWIIWDDKKNIPVGFTGVFPRPAYVNGQQYMCWNCGDFSIEKKYRALGVALKLRRAAKDCIDNSEPPFLYAHPNERMEVIHLKVGHKKMAHMHRYALPIRLTRQVQSVVKNSKLAFFLAKPFNLLLSFKYRFSTFLGLSGKMYPDIQVNNDHDELYRKMTEAFPVVADRSNKYLNWKFGSNPNQKYQQFDLFYKNHLVGTIFFVHKGDVVHIIDVLIDDFDRYSSQLFRMFINYVRKSFSRSIVSLSFILAEFNPFVRDLKKLGFKYRSDATSGAIAYANEEQNSELAETVMDGKKWFMTVGDRDA